MTHLETLQKYGLKPDVPSIKKRLMEDGYMIMAAEMSIDGGKFETHDIIVIAKVIKFSDLALLCSLAEKGERYEKAVKDLKDLEICRHDAVDSYIENWEKSLHSAKIEACEEIEAEAEGE